MLFFKPHISFPLNFASPFSVMTQNSSEIFQLKHMLPDPILDLISVRLSDATHHNIKGAEATCVEIASEIKKML